MSVRNRKGLITLLKYNSKFGDLTAETQFKEDKNLTDVQKEELLNELIEQILDYDPEHNWSEKTVIINQNGLNLLKELKDEQSRSELVLI